jgi:hypothetical protein
LATLEASGIELGFAHELYMKDASRTIAYGRMRNLINA